LLVVAGLVAATGLAILSFVRVSVSGTDVGITYREPQRFGTEAILLVSQPGFPWGRSITERYEFRVDATGQRVAEPLFANPSRFSDLAELYSHLVVSDEVRRLMEKDGPVVGEFSSDIVGPDGQSDLPLVRVLAIAGTPDAAISTAQRVVSAFLEFLEREQETNKIAARDRVTVELVQRPVQAGLIEPRKITRAVMVFLAVMIAVMGLAFVLENLRPRPRTDEEQEAEVDLVITPVRRTSSG
jgi:hypothetical protein